MELQLISGVFTIEEAEKLLTDIFNIKIKFHEKRIGSHHDNEEDIKHSEKKIIQLQATLREAIAKLKKSDKTHTALNAHIEVNTTEKLN